jgi:tripartite-type tricarboxylate transporter receptor subunit TctC
MALISRRRLLGQVAGAATWAAASGMAHADTYPSRRIRLVIPYAAGASGDQIGRPWAEKVTELLGPVYVENIAGAGGALGCAAVARDEADGYSLLLGTVSSHVIVPLTSPHLPYDPIADFRPIYRLISTALALVVHPSVPAYNLQELAAYAKANPGTLSYGTPGVGTGNHMVGEFFKQQAGAADIVHVPYRGMAIATNDLIGGQITMMISVVSAPLLELSRAGKLRILAVTSGQRLHAAPELQTVGEQGMPMLRDEGWFGLFAARATSDEIINRIAQTTLTVMADPLLQESYRAQGLEPDTSSSPDKFQKLMQDDFARLAPIIQSIGLRHD